MYVYSIHHGSWWTSVRKILGVGPENLGGGQKIWGGVRGPNRPFWSNLTLKLSILPSVRIDFGPVFACVLRRFGPDDICDNFGARARTLKSGVILSQKSMRTQGKMSVISVTFSVTFGPPGDPPRPPQNRVFFGGVNRPQKRRKHDTE